MASMMGGRPDKSFCPLMGTGNASAVEAYLHGRVVQQVLSGNVTLAEA
jgi:hypothetical protein